MRQVIVRAALTVGRVDPLRGRTRVVEAVTEVNGMLVFGTPAAHQSRSVPAVQRMLGHASATLTLNRYGRLFGDELDGIADRLDQHRADSVRALADWGR